MKTQILKLLIPFLPFSVFAQTFTDSIITGALEKCTIFNQVNTYQPVAYYDSSFTYLLKPVENDLALGNNYRIEKYDTKMNLLNRVNIILKDKNSERKFSNLLYFQHKLYLLTSIKNKKDKKLSLYVQAIDKNTFIQSEDAREIAVINNKNNNANILRTDYSISEDGTKLLLHYSLDRINYVESQKNFYGKEIEEGQMAVSVFDKNFNQLWNQNIGKAIDSGFFVCEKYLVDNNANVFVMGESFENINQANYNYTYNEKSIIPVTFKYFSFVQPSNYKNSILYFGDYGKNCKQLNINPSGIFAKSVTIFPKDSVIICGGVYSKPDNISAEGIFSCKLNIKTGNTENVFAKKFAKENLVSQLNSEDLKLFQKATKNTELDPFTYKLSKLEQTSSGDYVFIAEQRLNGKLEEEKSSDVLAIYTTFNYGNLYVSSFSSNGEIKNISVVNKEQFSIENSTISYGYLVQKDKVFLIFNNIRKIDLRKFISFKFSKLLNTCLVEVDNVGKQTSKIIADFTKSNNNNVFIRPKATMSLPENNLIIYPVQSEGIKYRTYQIIHLIP